VFNTQATRSLALQALMMILPREHLEIATS
jgi:hypothetical protein